MNINPDDAKWTAYVLGELNKEERARVEKELEASAAAREMIADIRLATDLLKTEFAKEATVELTGQQRGAVAGAASPHRVRPLFRWAAIAGSVAAGLLIVAGIAVPSLLRSRQAPGQPAAALIPLNPPPQTMPTSADARSSRAPVPGAIREKAASVGVIDDKVSQPAALSGVFGGVLKAQQVGAPVANSFIANRAVAMAPPAAPAADRADRPRFNTEAYDFISDNPFIPVAQDPLATFSIDVDTASYANMRRFVTINQLPPKDSIRIEEMINYFNYDYPQPAGSHPIAAYTEVAAAPWKPDHRLVRIGIKARDIDISKRPPSNLVFLIDVSGSMATPEKLPMLKSAMKLMIDKLTEADHVSIVTYAGASGLRLPATSGDKKDIIHSAIDGLSAGGSTNGGAGILLAYEAAITSFIRGGINRVILATDGDFNVGVTNQGDLTRLIEEKAKSGVFLSVLGFGMGNYKDSTLEKLADKGNGNYAYIDTLNEARKVLVEEMSGTLMTVAKDVKVQVEFNPAQVNAYRLIGYENRMLRNQDFNDDKKDAGDMGAGHTVTALFEVVPRGVDIQAPGVDALKYQQPAQPTRRAESGELLDLKIRYKDPDGSVSQLLESPVLDRPTAFNSASTDFRFAAAVASFGMILRESPHKGQSTLDAVIDIAEKSKGADRNGYRDEFVKLVRKVKTLKDIQ